MQMIKPLFKSLTFSNLMHCTEISISSYPYKAGIMYCIVLFNSLILFFKSSKVVYAKILKYEY